LILMALAAPGQPAAQSADTPEELAVGTMRSIISAQAAYKHTRPDAGYACDVETLVTVCTDETNVPRATDGDVAACFAKGAPPK
jgi:hypothetical protein